MVVTINLISNTKSNGKITEVTVDNKLKSNRAVYTRENKLRLTLAAAYVSREHPV